MACCECCAAVLLLLILYNGNNLVKVGGNVMWMQASMKLLVKRGWAGVFGMIMEFLLQQEQIFVIII
jgi:hypothetical protein